MASANQLLILIPPHVVAETALLANLGTTATNPVTRASRFLPDPPPNRCPGTCGWACQSPTVLLVGSVRYDASDLGKLAVPPTSMHVRSGILIDIQLMQVYMCRGASRRFHTMEPHFASAVAWLLCYKRYQVAPLTVCSSYSVHVVQNILSGRYLGPLADRSRPEGKE